MSANASAPRAPQRSPFAIQELLGLSDNRESRDRYFESRDDRVLNLSESREPRSPYTPQFPLPASVASRVAYAAAFNAQAAVAAAFLPGPPLLHPPPDNTVLCELSTVAGSGYGEIRDQPTRHCLFIIELPKIRS
ncbi:hypothetical protein KGM_203569 [Danaus plexippus plexippus]|uniref:Uncharacterized protein n=1 Tax=Danaus plexippus plexippus TaxID=278856 RepID=A0A212EWP8_DANPL|nr:hypothetical protein KGM_203569 [Danaus plexippus plexippus]